MQRENFDSDRGTVDEEIIERHREIAASVLSSDPYKQRIGGEGVESEAGEECEAIDATTGETLATYWRGTAADVDQAVAAAQTAFDETWGEYSAAQRADAIDSIADALEERKTELARIDSLEMGKPNQHALFVDATIMIDQFRYFAGLARTADDGRRPSSASGKLAYTSREPYGVVGQISAWNFPSMFLAWKMGPALAAGNTIVFKPSPRSVLSTFEAVETMEKHLPSGTINVVPGTGPEVGERITNHPEIRKVSMTGSTAAGRSVMEGAATNIKALSLELGGKSPNIIFPDADLEKAVEGTLIASFFNQGEQCTAGSRLFVHSDVRDEFLERFTSEMERLTVGDPLAPLTDIGPLVDHKHLDRVQSYVDTALQEGADVLVGGGQPDDPELSGAPFFEPTVLTNVKNDHTVACDEIFGPVVSVIEWDDREEMIAQANDTEYGLTSAVWTTDVETAHETAEVLEAGTVWVNTYNDLFDHVPHGGYKQSGLGRELDEEAFESYRQTKTVLLNFGKLPRLG
ncbi:aldehyde dehydrogenase family protein [Halocatena marina]|uniref:aldehyde dehydrogenase family protein n=1 Tax=Halocatena marina TaxID=2934937 RepID=UPI00200C194E|nr:aldehyde dehydrogenase family protein [Halocatena marina]